MDLCSEDTYPAAKPTTHSESHSAWDVNLIFDGTRQSKRASFPRLLCLPEKRSRLVENKINTESVEREK